MQVTRNHKRIVWSLTGVAVIVAIGQVAGQDSVEPADPAAWGNDHVGKALPMYMTGEECLFCHRTDVGVTLNVEPHNNSLRPKAAVPTKWQEAWGRAELKSIVAETEHVLGSGPIQRYLKPNGAYGQLAIHDAMLRFDEIHRADGQWRDDLFANDCAGCHTTAVETEWKAFATPGLDCFVCHGDVSPGHQNNPAIALFSKEGRKKPLVEMSICGQCHLRGGTSESTGLPYPNQFVPADNLFRDFQVDFSSDTLAAMHPGDRHIFENTRDVIRGGEMSVTCTSCHDIHTATSVKHRDLEWSRWACGTCHEDPDDLSVVQQWESHSDVCQY